MTRDTSGVLKISFRRVRDGQLEPLRAWMNALMERQHEVRQTFEQEGVRHECAYLTQDREGYVLVYVAELEDEVAAHAAYARSTLPIDLEHRVIIAQLIVGPAEAELLYDVQR
jgi:hypothetical protein